MNDEHELKVILKSKFPVVVVQTFEELRALEVIERVTNLLDQPMFVWNAAEGLRRRNRTEVVTETREAPQVLRHIFSTPQNGVYVLLDFHHYLGDPVLLRHIKTIAHDYKKSPKTIVLLSHQVELPPDLSRMAARFELSITDLESVRELVRQELDTYTDQTAEKIRGQQEALDMLIQLLVGMSRDDARRMVRQALHDDGAITLADTARVLKQKHEAMGADAMLSLELDVAKWDDVAGLSQLKAWLDKRRVAFVETTSLEPPKGIMLLGVQGSGKSLAAKAVAGAWRVPLLRLDLAGLYSKWVGETERNLRDALKRAENMAPCVLWIDEIEKAIPNDAGGDSDAGLSRRLLGTLLTWMAERNSRVFLVATANDIEKLPPELIRKGRIDEIFFVDLPDESTRMDIFRIHLARRQQAIDVFDLKALAQAADGFSGAEIEQAVVAALYTCHAVNAKLTQGHLLDEMKATRPLSVIAAERIDALREWARERAVFAG